VESPGVFVFGGVWAANEAVCGSSAWAKYERMPHQNETGRLMINTPKKNRGHR